MAWRPLIIIEGPKEAMVLHKILEATVKQLRMHAPLKNVGETCSVYAVTAGRLHAILMN